jgi:protein SCO1
MCLSSSVLHGFTLLAVSGLLLVGCDTKPPSQATSSQPTNVPAGTTRLESTNKIGPNPSMANSQSAEPTNMVRSFLARGVVRELALERKAVIVRHEDIPGFMPKMTMEFDVRDTNELAGIKRGDAITFQVKANEEESWIEDIKRAGTNDMAPLPPADPTSSSLLRIAQLKTGHLVPDAALLAEDGSTIRMSDFRGRALAFTFIFSRCPLPDFCPRMNQHFNRARELLLQRPGGPTNWQFLSISFDAEFDKPEVLTRYAYSYRGKSTDHWLFASAPSDVMTAMASQLDFRFANEGGSFVHNLRTVVVDRHGRIHRQFDGNKWKASELAQALTEAAEPH